MKSACPVRCRAFTLIDLAAVICMISVLVVMLALSAAESRRAGRLDESVSHLKRFGEATGAFAADNAGIIWGFTWEGGETYEMLGLDGEFMRVTPANDQDAAELQAVHLIRLLGDRTGDNGMPLVNNWIPHVLYSHLPLQEYLGSRIPERWAVSPADEVRLNWQDDPENKFDQGLWLPLQPSPTPINRRWPYSSSYQLTSGAYDFSQSELDAQYNGMRVSQSGAHNTYSIPGNADFSRRLLSDVIYPSGKVHQHDTHQRHFGDRRPYFGLEEARVVMSMFDGSAGVRMTSDANPGWRPNTPTFPCMTFFYQPSSWEPETTNGQFQEFVKGYYRWTRGGLKGLDFGGLPLDTGQGSPGECNL